MTVQHVPDGYHTVTPYLVVRGAAEALAFYARAFGARERFRLAAPDGKVAHAELVIGDSTIMIADEVPERGHHGPEHFGGSPVNLTVYVEDVDAVARQAVAAGAKELRPPKDQFYGDRTGGYQDPFGHLWTLATHKEDVSPEEMKRRAEKLFGGSA
jgi:PhnB protein